MTEAEWLTSEDIGRLIEYLDSRPDRRRRLDYFGLACCRRVQLHISDERSQRALSLIDRQPIEELADDEYEALRDSTAAAASMCEPLSAEFYAARAVHDVVYGHDRGAARNCAQAKGVLGGTEGVRSEERVQLNYLRCIFGNPFRPVTFDPDWRTSAVLGLASAIYADRAFDQLPILADALEDAGCGQPDVLAHCRSDGPHVRGCWAVDLILGKS